MEHIDKCAEAGLIHIMGRNKMDSVWMVVGPHEELLTICNCCPCCCLWRVYTNLSDNIQNDFYKLPGVSVQLDVDDCVGCGKCKDGYYLEDLDSVLSNEKLQEVDIIINSDSEITNEQLINIKNSNKTLRLNYYDEKIKKGKLRGVESCGMMCSIEELGSTNVAVVCAGAKAILDLPRTLEYLETKGVLVVGYQTDYLPAFYTRTSEYKLEYRMDTPKEIAESLYAKEQLGLKGGMLIANPIPAEYSLDETLMNNAINQAIKEMNEQNIIGKQTTPFLLKRITEITGGDSLASNIKLVYNNCLLASLIAKELCILNK